MTSKKNSMNIESRGGQRTVSAGFRAQTLNPDKPVGAEPWSIPDC